MHAHKDKYVIDFTAVENYRQIHTVIKEALNFPDYYGCNWSAFWDCLTDMEMPINIEVLGMANIERRFDGVAKTIVDIFKELKHYDNEGHDIHIAIVYDDGITVIE